ncbi:Zinc uptake regulation protein ZUR [Actinomycetales bacterium JB111]|nr:Zinc uptake regulation protein ZUR [Actinomycetales bacterium JB111]
MVQHRRTWQQSAVAEALDQVPSFVSAQDLHRRLMDSDQQVGLATVYRVLKRLEEAGDVDALITTDGETLYRACERGHHHHLVCENCGATVDFTSPDETWMDEIAASHGFTPKRHVVDIYGLCRDCQAALA